MIRLRKGKPETHGYPQQMNYLMLFTASAVTIAVVAAIFVP